MATGRRRLRKSVKKLDKKKRDNNDVYSGLLGTPLNGNEQVSVEGRNGFVWVRLRDNQSELIQAFNRTVAPIYDYPVLVKRKADNTAIYEVFDVDSERYLGQVGATSAVPIHAGQHMFNPDSPGADIVWAYDQQLMPLLAHPSGTLGAGNVVIEPDVYYQDATWKYGGNTGTPDIVGLKPTNNQAKMILIYLDADSNPKLVEGSLFDATLTGTAQLIPHVPTLISTSDIPVAWVRLVSGTSVIGWENLYDARPWIVGDGNLSTGTSVTFATLEEAQEGQSGTRVIAPNTLPIISPNKGIFRTDETTTGNARGTGSVDFQSHRSSTNQVASGLFTALLGGFDNKAEDYASGLLAGGQNSITDENTGDGYNSIVGGQSNNIHGGNNGSIIGGTSALITGTSTTNSAIIGGWSTELNQSTESVIAGGFGNKVWWGDRAFIGGGLSNLVSGSSASSNTIIGSSNSRVENVDNCVILGGSAARIYNKNLQIASGAGQGRLLGSETRQIVQIGSTTNQRTHLLWVKETLSGSQTEMFLNGFTERAILEDNTAWAFEILLVARRSDASGESGAYKFTGLIHRDSGAASTAIVGSVTKTVIAESTAAWDAVVDADTTNGSLRIRVTGENSKTIHWFASGHIAQGQ